MQSLLQCLRGCNVVIQIFGCQGSTSEHKLDTVHFMHSVQEAWKALLQTVGTKPCSGFVTAVSWQHFTLDILTTCQHFTFLTLYLSSHRPALSVIISACNSSGEQHYAMMRWAVMKHWLISLLQPMLKLSPAISLLNTQIKNIGASKGLRNPLIFEKDPRCVRRDFSIYRILPIVSRLRL